MSLRRGLAAASVLTVFLACGGGGDGTDAPTTRAAGSSGAAPGGSPSTAGGQGAAGKASGATGAAGHAAGSTAGGGSVSGGAAGAPKGGGAPAGAGGNTDGGAGGEAEAGAGGTAAGGKAGAASSNVCPCYSGDGPYCGSGVKDHVGSAGCVVPELAGHAGDILTCKDGSWTVGKSCSAGCDVIAPGDADACSVPDCKCFVTDAWCGAGAQDHADGLKPPCTVPLVPAHNDDILACSAKGDWIVKESCPKGCHQNPTGVADACNDDSQYDLPWACGGTFTCTQGNDQGDHVGSQLYAYDFNMAYGTPIHASRGGTVAYAETRSPKGSECFNTSHLDENCHNKANFVAIKDADNAVLLYMHLSELDVKVGAKVARGDVIGKSGNSGYSTGPHIHVQLQHDCGIWFCSSVPLHFAEDASITGGNKEKSGNCP